MTSYYLLLCIFYQLLCFFQKARFSRCAYAPGDFCASMRISRLITLGLLVLNVSDNQNLSGYLPEFNNTSPFTGFSGNILDSIGNLQSMEGLRARGCYFSGPIPVGNLTQLTSVASNMIINSGVLSWPHKLTILGETFNKPIYMVIFHHLLQT